MALILAAPGRYENTKWRRFFEQPNVRFQAVERSTAGKPGDVALIDVVESLIQSSEVSHIALLVSDRDFISCVRDAKASGRKVTVIVPEARFYVADGYRQQDVDVHILKRETKHMSKVKVLLIPRAKGKVELCSPIPTDECGEEFATIKKQLTELRYCAPDQRDDFMINPIAKFWHSNCTRPIMLYPLHCGIMQLHKFLASSAGLKPCQRETAFFLPMRQKHQSARVKRKFGSRRACRLYHGGGPFVLDDSPQLPASAFKRLGFLDRKQSSEVRESTFVL